MSFAASNAPVADPPEKQGLAHSRTAVNVNPSPCQDYQSHNAHITGLLAFLSGFLTGNKSVTLDQELSDQDVWNEETSEVPALELQVYLEQVASQPSDPSIILSSMAS